jgi:ABC-type uncharacterized transport system substrate-binding protein
MRWLLAILVVLFMVLIAEFAIADTEDIDVSMVQHGPRLTEIVVTFEDNTEKIVMVENKDLESPKTFDKVQALIKEYENERSQKRAK